MIVNPTTRGKVLRINNKIPHIFIGFTFFNMPQIISIGDNIEPIYTNAIKLKPKIRLWL